MFRYALQKYIISPEREKNVIFFSEDYVIVKDVYPKSLRHYLVMPRNEKLSQLHPLVALQDQDLVASMQGAVKHARQLLSDSLVEAGILTPADVPHFQKTFVRAGVHSVPSMSNLHIHVISQDFHSPSMKNKKHYNSFTTGFFVDFPEEKEIDEKADPGINSQSPAASSHTDTESSPESGEDSEQFAVSGGKLMLGRGKRTRGKYPDIIRGSPLRCTYCGRSYGNKFSTLKSHLAHEFRGKFGVRDPALTNVRVPNTP